MRLCGYDIRKKTNGRKRHLLIDTFALLLIALVTAASVQGRNGAREFPHALLGARRKLRTISADSSYAGRLVRSAAQRFRFYVSVVRRA